MRRRRILAALAAAVLPLGLVTLGTAPARADYVPAPYSAAATSSILSTSVSALAPITDSVPGMPGTISAELGLAGASTDSQAAVRTSADGANVAAGAVGLGLTVASGHSEQPAGPATDDWTTVSADLSPVADVGVLSGTTAANWAGDTACVPDGTPLSTSSTTLAGADLLPLPSILGVVPPITGASVGVARTTTTTALVDNAATGDARDVVSTATASLASLSLLTGAVQVDVTGDATLVSTASGDAATTHTTYTPPAVTVTVPGSTQSLALGEPLALTIPVVANLADATVTLTLNDVTDSGSGLTAAGSVPAVLSVEIAVNALGSQVLTSSLALLPLQTEATAPAGGVECALPAPVITAPEDGAWTTSTPTITGTGVPGATVTVVIDGDEAGTAVVGDDGTWTFPVTEPLAPGRHDVVATQTLDGLTSSESNNPTFNVADPPVITAPEDGSTTSDNTPPITGTGEPGAEVDVVVDGESLGTVTVSDDGTWTLQPTTPLAAGEHTVDATQTDAGGHPLDAAQVSFTVALAPPVVTAPEDGSSTDDPTPTIEGTGAPGATVTVVIDGDEVGTAVVGDDGTWTLELTDELACGPHTVTATQDLNGLVSEASVPVDFTVTCAAEEPADSGPTPTAEPNNGGPTPTPQESTTLPDTGASAALGAAGLLGLALLAGGVFLLRRRRA